MIETSATRWRFGGPSAASSVCREGKKENFGGN
jgi:hypothetical protein